MKQLSEIILACLYIIGVAVDACPVFRVNQKLYPYWGEDMRIYRKGRSLAVG